MRIGIDLGGTKIESIALDGARTLVRRRIATPRGDYGETIAAIRSLIEAIRAETKQRGTVGVGIPGAISAKTGLVKNANSTWLIGKPLLRDLEHALGHEVRISNDANCFALSEAVDGAAKGARTVFGVIVGTGTGGGIVINGHVVEGRQRIAGEWGHNPLPWPANDELPGPPCYCGKRGCIETFLSGPGLTRAYGSDADAAEITRRAAAGESRAQQTLDVYEGRFARALASVINVLDPEVIVLGGGLSNINRLYQNVPALWAPFVFSDTTDTSLVQARHGDSSGVRGAAWLWNEGDAG